MTRPLFVLLAASAVCVAADDPFRSTVQPFFAKNCLMCHSAKLHTADLNLERFTSADAVTHDRDTWEHILDKISSGTMPPKGIPRPPKESAAAVTNWIQRQFEEYDAQQKPDPGRVTARRLNRYEYNATVRDVLGIDFKPADNFPADDSGYGFDNNGDVLSLSPVLMEKYLIAAESIANRAITGDVMPKAVVQRERCGKPHGCRDGFSASHQFPADGDYDLHVSYSGMDPHPTEAAHIVLMLDGAREKLFDIPVDGDERKPLDIRVHVAYGAHILSGQAVATETSSQKISIDALEVRGPFNALPPPPSEAYKRILVCGDVQGVHTPECVQRMISVLASRMYRRPVSDEEVRRLVGFVTDAQQQGDTFEQGMRVALEAMLVSPHFLFRIERDPQPNNPDAAHRVGDFELASRLSYFLWSSAPDDELFRLAAIGRLHEPKYLNAQTLRMLQDPRAKALIENFAGQWLELRNLDSIRPDPERFPGFDDKLRSDMRQETQMFLGEIIHQDRSLLDLIDGKFTYLNERLAKHYGIEGVTGDQFRRVDLTGDERSGILTQASILTVTSYPNRTSPVLRGKWILENVLNTPPPPPPANAGSLNEDAVDKNGTVRQQFEQHRANPMCASCHVRMDPLGFGLENYDAIGRWRTHEGKFPVDPSGVLPSGKSFQSAAELKVILKSNSVAFAACLADKLLTYGLGRGLERYDRPAVQQIAKATAADGYRFSRLIIEIVNSMPFQMRRGEAPTELQHASLAAKHAGGL